MYVCVRERAQPCNWPLIQHVMWIHYFLSVHRINETQISPKASRTTLWLMGRSYPGTLWSRPSRKSFRNYPLRGEPFYWPCYMWVWKSVWECTLSRWLLICPTLTHVWWPGKPFTWSNRLSWSENVLAWSLHKAKCPGETMACVSTGTR